jgi:hypothetical protein
MFSVDLVTSATFSGKKQLLFGKIRGMKDGFNFDFFGWIGLTHIDNAGFVVRFGVFRPHLLSNHRFAWKSLLLLLMAENFSYAAAGRG